MNSEIEDLEHGRFVKRVARIKEYLAPSLAEDWPMLPVIRAKGSYVVSTTGRRYLDFTSGIAVANIGHCHPKVIKAAKDQMEKMIHGAVGVTVHESLLRLCEVLQDRLPGLDAFFFGNSGTEAIEAAIKMARFVTRRPGIIAFEGGFHGRSYGAASASAIKSKYRTNYEPFLPSVYFAPYAYPYRCPLGEDPEVVTSFSLGRLRSLFSHIISPSDVAAILVEPIQGEGGYIVPPKSFLRGLRDICDEYEILLIADEIQTGFGRSGDMFACTGFDVKPDILAMAKGIASGFPLSAIATNHSLMRQWSAGSHGTTFGGNPVSCAAAVATIQAIEEEGLLRNCREMGNRLLSGLKQLERKFDVIGEVRGCGLMLAIELIQPNTIKDPNPEAASDILNKIFDRGMLAYFGGTQGHTIRFMPPISINDREIDQGLEIIGASFEEYGRQSEEANSPNV